MPKFVIDSQEVEKSHVVKLVTSYTGRVEIRVDDYIIAIITKEGELKLIGGVSSSTGLKLLQDKVVVIS